eukprot:284129-Pelagomonas_calceolata.AAC.5
MNLHHKTEYQEIQQGQEGLGNCFSHFKSGGPPLPLAFFSIAKKRDCSGSHTYIQTYKGQTLHMRAGQRNNMPIALQSVYNTL